MTVLPVPGAADTIKIELYTNEESTSANKLYKENLRALGRHFSLIVNNFSLQNLINRTGMKF